MLWSVRESTGPAFEIHGLLQGSNLLKRPIEKEVFEDFPPSAHVYRAEDMTAMRNYSAACTESHIYSSPKLKSYP